MAKQFQVTLLSNACESLFPENVPNRFTSKLYSPIDLKGDWEVALLGILYPFTTQNVNETIRIGMLIIGSQDNRVHTLDFEARRNFGGWVRDAGFPRIPLAYREIFIQPGYYRTIAEFYDRLNAKTQAALQTLEDKRPTRFLYDPVEDLTTIEKGERGLVLFTKYQYFPDLLGGEIETKLGSKRLFLDEDWHGRSSPQLARVNTMFVYTDIIKYQVVGDIQAPLLSALPVNGIPGQQVYWHVNEPNFIPVAKNYIQTIDIRICTETGQPFPITNKGIVVCILSFRQKHYK